MPIYDWKCRRCGEEYEAIAPMSEEGTKMRCPRCGTVGADKQMSSFTCGPGKGPDRPRGGPGCGHNHQGGGG